MAASYKQFCPVAMAAEILCTRWTVVLMRELIAGSTRFNDLRRGVPRMSPALLAQRLRELEDAGIVTRRPLADSPSTSEYILTEAGQDLRSVIEAIGVWGQRWVDTDLSLDNLDPSLLMWDMRRNLDTTPLPTTRSVIQFEFVNLARAQKFWWLIVEADGTVDLCSVDPGFEVDLYVTTPLRAMTAIWMGHSTVTREVQSGQMQLDGAPALERNMQQWLGLSPFAVEKNRRTG